MTTWFRLDELGPQAEAAGVSVALRRRACDARIEITDDEPVPYACPECDRPTTDSEETK